MFYGNASVNVAGFGGVGLLTSLVGGTGICWNLHYVLVLS